MWDDCFIVTLRRMVASVWVMDSADITQSQARDTTHRRMQEVNGFCTDSRALRVEYSIVGIPHNTAV